MPELRWILLAVGALFIIGLAVWEMRRARRGKAGGFPESSLQAREPRVLREPSLTLPEIHPRDPPTLTASDDSTIGLRIDGARIEEESASEPYLSEPIVPDPPTLQAAAPPPPTIQPPAEPIVDWPPEGLRRIVALRLVAPGTDRFFGRIVRQALKAEGFVLGKYAIFHKAGADGRAIMSAASLTKPGTFDLDLMDSQRYSGLSLFAVLPGPLPDVEAFDELVATARALNGRLQGVLQDGRGEPLTAARIATLREGLAAAQRESAEAAGREAAPSSEQSSEPA